MKRKRAILALALLVPAPSLGVLAGMILFPGTLLGQGLFAFSKLWLFLLPVLWLKLVDRERLSFSPLRQGGLGLGFLSGCGISLFILRGGNECCRFLTNQNRTLQGTRPRIAPKEITAILHRW